MASLKVSELNSFLDKFAKTLERNKADDSAVRDIRELCTMFSGSEAKTVAAFLKAIALLPRSASTQSGNSPIGDVIPAIVSLQNLVNEVAKKDLCSSLASLLVVLRVHAATPISSFVSHVLSPPIPTDKKNRGSGGKKDSPSVADYGLAEDYVKRLEAVLGDDVKFTPLFKELHADPRVTQAEAVAIASKFYGRTAKSTPRPRALERVRERHEKLMKFKKQRSTSGRSAA